MKVETFHDFPFTANHRLHGRSPRAALRHTHEYVIRFWFAMAPDHDDLDILLVGRFGRLRGVALDALLPDSSDEGLAAFFLREMQKEGCIRVTVFTDKRGGSEATR